MERSELTKNQRWKLAEILAKERLPYINERVKKVYPRNNFYSLYGKRVFDIAISLIAIILSLPLNLLIGAITLFDVGIPIFFHQERLGKNGRIFEIVKFRNMRNTKDDRGELLPPEKRVTRFGKFVRKTSLDELLNFWSILKGDMSIIGPRPLVPEYKARFNKRHAQRMLVRPGLECPPHKSINHVWTWQEQFENDIWYVENISFKTDCFMLWQLFKFAVDRKSSEARAVSARGIFTGYDLNGRAITLDEVPQSYIDNIGQDDN